MPHMMPQSVCLLVAIAWAGLVFPGAARADSKTAEGPRPAQAGLDMRGLADALTLCAVDTGFYVSLETLNDTPLEQDNDPWDPINAEGGTHVIRPERGLFEPERVDLVAAFLEWRGPYINYQQGRVQTAPGPYDQGSPLDPWGQPYYFFTPLGLVRGDPGTITPELYGDAFDRPTIVSLGPDAELGGGDDLAYEFGAGVTQAVISSVVQPGSQWGEGSGFVLTAGASATVRGYNLGTPTAPLRQQAGDFRVELNGAPLDVGDWQGEAVTVTLPGKATTGTLVVHTGGTPTNGLRVTLNEPPARSHRWMLYD